MTSFSADCGRAPRLLLLTFALASIAPEVHAQRRHRRQRDAEPSATTGQVMVVTDPSGASVAVDTVSAGVSPVRLDNLSPGDHLVTAMLNGAAATQVVSVAAGRSQVIQLSLRAPTPAAPPPARASAAPPPLPRASGDTASSQVSVAAPTIVGIEQRPPTAPSQAAGDASRTTETAAETEIVYDWYRPSQQDRELAWNSRNAWNSKNDYPIGLSIGVHPLLSAYDTGTPDATVIDSTLRVGFGHVGLSLGVATLPSGPAPMLGLHFARNGGWPIVDLRQPDLQFGLLWPTVEIRAGGYTRPIGRSGDDVPYFVYNGSLGLSGIRVAWADFVLFDIRPVLSVWGIGDRYNNGAVINHFPAMGVSFDLSVNL